MRKVIPGAVLACAMALSAFGQEKGSVGVEAMVGSSSGTIGARWHISKKFALRPLISFSRTTSEQDTTVIADNTSVVGAQNALDWTLGVGVAGLYYLSQSDSLSTYVGVSYDHVHQSTSLNPLIFPPIDATVTPDLARLVAEAAVFPPSRTTGDADEVGVLLGAQHAFSKKLTLFGEVSVRYQSGRSNEDVNISAIGAAGAIINGSANSQKTIESVNAGVGIIFYLK